MDLYKDWNDKINVISRKDIEEIELKHFLHSLSIAKVFDFKEGSEILDFGTGGGFPGIPLAIYFPHVKFTLIDSIAKKTRVVQAITSELDLKNVLVETGRVEELNSKYDFITCRAVGRLSKIMPWVSKSIKKESMNQKPNGYIFLKGGDLSEEMKEGKYKYNRIPISDIFQEAFFETKEIVYLPK